MEHCGREPAFFKRIAPETALPIYKMLVVLSDQQGGSGSGMVT